MSSAAPPGRHLRNHVFIETAESWASVRQIKTIDQSRLGDRIATAGADELEETVEILVQRLGKQNSAGAIQTPQGEEQIGVGTLAVVDFHDEHGSSQRTEMLVLDYNQGNDIVIAVEVEYRTAPNSPVRIPYRCDGYFAIGVSPCTQGKVYRCGRQERAQDRSSQRREHDVSGPSLAGGVRRVEFTDD